MRLSRRFFHRLSILTLATALLAPVRAEWTFHSFPLSNTMVYDLAVREDTLYLYSSFPAGLYRSRDDGRTWNLLNPVPGDYSGLEADGREVFFFGGAGILRSRDNGETWQAADRGVEGEVRDILLSGGILYAATSEGTFRSADRGDTWKRVLPAMGSEFFSMTSVDGILFASCITLNQDSSLFRSDDNGLSWKLATLPATSLGFVSPVTGHGGYLYIVTSRAGVMRGRPDGSNGFTWQQVPLGDGSRPHFTLWSHGTTLYAYSMPGLFQSPDSGRTWHPHGPGESRGEAFLRYAMGSRLFEQAEDYALNESRDNGVTWRPLDLPKRPTDYLQHMYSSGPNLIAYRRGGPAYLSRDLGRAWSGPVENGLQGMAETGGRLFASVGYGNFLYSEDHGGRWSSLLQPAGLIRPSNFLGAQDGWLYSGSDSVYRRPAALERLSFEACAVLKPAPLPAVPTQYFTQVITAGSLVFAGSWDGRWQYSANSGTSWQAVDSVLQAAKPRALVGGTPWVAATAQGVFRSPDGVRDWIKVESGLDAAFSVLRHGAALFVGGRKGRIAYSLDQGLSWKSLDSLAGPDTVSSLAVQSGSLAVLYPLQGIWSRPLPEGVVAVKPAPESAPAKTGLEIRPGTLRPGDAVGIVLAAPARVRLFLHSVDGRRMAILRMGGMGAGRHAVPLDPDRLRGLPRGLYLLELRAGNGRWSTRVLLDQ